MTSAPPHNEPTPPPTRTIHSRKGKTDWKEEPDSINLDSCIINCASLVERYGFSLQELPETLSRPEPTLTAILPALPEARLLRHGLSEHIVKEREEKSE
jgi:hypothetical protein